MKKKHTERHLALNRVRNQAGLLALGIYGVILMILFVTQVIGPNGFPVLHAKIWLFSIYGFVPIGVFLISGHTKFFLGMTIHFALSSYEYHLHELDGIDQDPEDPRIVMYGRLMEEAYALLDRLHIASERKKEDTTLLVNSQVAKITVTEGCRYENGGAEFSHGSLRFGFGTRIIEPTAMLLNADFPGGGIPSEPTIVQCTCGCQRFRVYTKDARFVAISLRDRQDLWNAVSKLRTEGCVDPSEDMLLRDEINGMKFADLNIIAEYSMQ